MSESVCGNRFNGFRWRTVLFISTVYRFELQLSYLTPELNDSAALISANLLLPTNKTVETVLQLASAVNPELKLGENEMDFCKSLFSMSDIRSQGESLLKHHHQLQNCSETSHAFNCLVKGMLCYNGLPNKLVSRSSITRILQGSRQAYLL